MIDVIISSKISFDLKKHKDIMFELIEHDLGLKELIENKKFFCYSGCIRGFSTPSAIVRKIYKRNCNVFCSLVLSKQNNDVKYFIDEGTIFVKPMFAEKTMKLESLYFTFEK